MNASCCILSGALGLRSAWLPAAPSCALGTVALGRKRSRCNKQPPEPRARHRRLLLEERPLQGGRRAGSLPPVLRASPSCGGANPSAQRT